MVTPPLPAPHPKGGKAAAPRISGFALWYVAISYLVGLAGGLAGQSVGLPAWLAGYLVCWMVGLLVIWLVGSRGWLASWMARLRSFTGMASWLASWLARLVGWI